MHDLHLCVLLIQYNLQLIKEPTTGMLIEVMTEKHFSS